MTRRRLRRVWMVAIALLSSSSLAGGGLAVAHAAEAARTERIYGGVGEARSEPRFADAPVLQEPGALLLFGSGLFAAASLARRRRSGSPSASSAGVDRHVPVPRVIPESSGI